METMTLKMGYVPRMGNSEEQRSRGSTSQSEEANRWRLEAIENGRLVAVAKSEQENEGGRRVK